MFGLGMGEIVIILVLALILLGPQRLPDAAKQLGKGLREFRKATEDLKNQFESELYQEPKPSRPTLVETPGEKSQAEGPGVPAGGVPRASSGEVPLATAENVPGLEAALAEPAALAQPSAPNEAPAAPGAAKAS